MGGLSTIRKIGPVLDLFTAERPQWRMTDIARALGMPKSSAHTLVTTLAEVGLLSPGDHGQYRLGWNLLSLSERMRAGVAFRRHALPHMQTLAADTGEAVLLAVLDRDEVVYIERVEGTHPSVRLAGVRVGARLPAHCTGVGKVLLAHRPPEEVRSLMRASGLKRLTPRSIADLDALEEILVTVRSQGIGYDVGEVVRDVVCVGAPVTDYYRTVIAAVSISMPAYRFPQDRQGLIGELQRSARKMSQAIARAEREAGASSVDEELPTRTQGFFTP